MKTLQQMLTDLPPERRLKIERRFWELVLEAHNEQGAPLARIEAGTAATGNTDVARRARAGIAPPDTTTPSSQDTDQ